MKSEESKRRANDRRRERYANDPEYAAKRRAANDKWKSENQDSIRRYVREVMRKNYARNPEKVWQYKVGWKYGMTAEEYDAKLAAQGGVCAICGKENIVSGSRIRLCVDHCHVTGAIRDLLCKNCNLGIGFLDDDVSRVLAAAEYLKKHAI